MDHAADESRLEQIGTVNKRTLLSPFGYPEIDFQIEFDSGSALTGIPARSRLPFACVGGSVF